MENYVQNSCSKINILKLKKFNEMKIKDYINFLFLDFNC